MRAPVSEYDLTFSDRGEFLVATLRAVSVSAEMAPRIFSEIRTAMVDKRMGRLLLRYEVAHTPSEKETLQVVTELMRKLPGMRIAFVNENQNHASALSFSAALGFESGEDYQPFTDMHSAEKWLMES